jgi:hypothetical protein
MIVPSFFDLKPQRMLPGFDYLDAAGIAAISQAS